MEERTDHVTVYVAHHVASHLLDNEQYRKFWEGYFDYAFYGIAPDFGDGKELLIVWEVVRGTIDRGIAQQLGGKKGGKSSGETRKTSKTGASLEPTFEATFEQVKVNNNGNINKKKKREYAQIAAGDYICRDCGGKVEKSSCSPNYVCAQCFSVYEPKNLVTLQRKEAQ